MESVVLVIHLILALAIIGLVLLQRSEGGGLGIGSSGGMGAFASAQTAANALTRVTAICAAGFFATSLTLGVLAGVHHRDRIDLSKALEKPLPATAAPVAGVESGPPPVQAQEEVKPEPPAQPPTAPVSSE